MHAVGMKLSYRFQMLPHACVLGMILCMKHASKYYHIVDVASTSLELM